MITPTFDAVVRDVYTPDLLVRLADLPAGAYVQTTDFHQDERTGDWTAYLVWTRRIHDDCALYVPIRLREHIHIGREVAAVIRALERALLEAVQTLHFLRAYVDRGPYG